MGLKIKNCGIKRYCMCLGISYQQSRKKIWLTSKEGKGTAFFFTIPENDDRLLDLLRNNSNRYKKAYRCL
ncbi:MAG: hypothetical protein QMD92_04845, partial [bacterium]|nr:hypothetical protein [bacterium]